VLSCVLGMEALILYRRLVFRVKNTSSQVTHLQWDHPGSKLLVGTEGGEVEVYMTVDHLLNKWQIAYTGAFPGEPIVTSCWLNLPRKVGVLRERVAYVCSI
jgi:hypothetical protein